MIAHTPEILAANAQDVDAAAGSKFLDRLTLTEARIQDMATGLRQLASLQDPTAKADQAWRNEAGLLIIQQRVPLGVVGIIYEARPNVTADAAGLTLKSGNAVILRGGKEALRSNMAVVNVLQAALKSVDLPELAVQLVTDQVTKSPIK